MSKFWNWVSQGAGGQPELHIDQVILQEPDWWDGSGDTPKAFRAELDAQGGQDITLWINSDGGDVFAAASIYTMLKEYPGRVTVKIDGRAASAASIIAMAGDEILMSPPSSLMIHRAWCVTRGNGPAHDVVRAQLDEIDQAMIDVYQLKTGLDRATIETMMDNESIIHAARAVELGFADGVLYRDEEGGNFLPAACVLTSRGVYAYAGIPREHDPNAEERQRIAQESRALLEKLHAQH